MVAVQYLPEPVCRDAALRQHGHRSPTRVDELLRSSPPGRQLSDVGASLFSRGLERAITGGGRDWSCEHASNAQDSTNVILRPFQAGRDLRDRLVILDIAAHDLRMPVSSAFALPLDALVIAGAAVTDDVVAGGVLGRAFMAALEGVWILINALRCWTAAGRSR